MLNILRGLLGLALVAINTIIGIIPLMLVTLVKLVIPIEGVQRRCMRGALWIAEIWVEVNKHIINLLLDTQWDVRGHVDVSRDKSYLLLSNHLSSVDIPVILQVFNRQVPYYKFFLKWTLVFLPLIGQAVWALEYPLMRRYPKKKLEKHPELKDRDLEIARKSCEKSRGMPITVINYPEGARFTTTDQIAQGSGYRNLLRPKAGGIYFVLSSIGEQIDTILDVTIVYPDGVPNFWDFATNQVRRVIVDISQFPLEQKWVEGDYRNDPEFRARFQQWLNDYWREKDERITAIREQETG